MWHVRGRHWRSYRPAPDGDTCIGADGKYVGNYNTEGVSIVRQTAVELQAEIQAASVNGEGIALVWTGGETVASKYRVLRKEGNGEFQAIAKVSQAGYLDKNVEIGKTYTYTIRLIGSDGKYIGTYDQTGFTVSYNP